ncbi:hypothetical protein D3C81_1715900 [compost metagenome]
MSLGNSNIEPFLVKGVYNLIYHDSYSIDVTCCKNISQLFNVLLIYIYCMILMIMVRIIEDSSFTLASLGITDFKRMQIQLPDRPNSCQAVTKCNDDRRVYAIHQLPINS